MLQLNHLIATDHYCVCVKALNDETDVIEKAKYYKIYQLLDNSLDKYFCTFYFHIWNIWGNIITYSNIFALST